MSIPPPLPQMFLFFHLLLSLFNFIFYIIFLSFQRMGKFCIVWSSSSSLNLTFNFFFCCSSFHSCLYVCMVWCIYLYKILWTGNCFPFNISFRTSLITTVANNKRCWWWVIWRSAHFILFYSKIYGSK